MKNQYHWVQLKNGNKRTCGYIEQRGAKIGNRVQMIDIDNEFWDVLTVSEGVDKSLIRENEKQHKKVFWSHTITNV